MNTSKCPLSLSQGHVQLKYPKPRHSLVYSPNPSMACEVLSSFIPVHPLTSLCSVLILTAYSAHTDFFRFLDCTLLSPATSLLHTMFPWKVLPRLYLPMNSLLILQFSAPSAPSGMASLSKAKGMACPSTPPSEHLLSLLQHT